MGIHPEAGGRERRERATEKQRVGVSLVLKLTTNHRRPCEADTQTDRAPQTFKTLPLSTVGALSPSAGDSLTHAPSPPSHVQDTGSFNSGARRAPWRIPLALLSASIVASSLEEVTLFFKSSRGRQEVKLEWYYSGGGSSIVVAKGVRCKARIASLSLSVCVFNIPSQARTLEKSLKESEGSLTHILGSWVSGQIQVLELPSRGLLVPYCICGLVSALKEEEEESGRVCVLWPNWSSQRVPPLALAVGHLRSQSLLTDQQSQTLISAGEMTTSRFSALFSIQSKLWVWTDAIWLM